jgi:hypothetical protein
MQRRIALVELSEAFGEEELVASRQLGRYQRR